MKKLLSFVSLMTTLAFSSCVSIKEFHGDLTVFNSDGSILESFEDITWHEIYKRGYNPSLTETASFGSGVIEFTTNDGRRLKICNAPWQLEYWVVNKQKSQKAGAAYNSEESGNDGVYAY